MQTNTHEWTRICFTQRREPQETRRNAEKETQIINSVRRVRLIRPTGQTAQAHVEIVEYSYDFLIMSFRSN